MTHSGEPNFPLTYQAGRARFLGQALRKHGAIQSLINPVAAGPEGEPLATDIVWFGPEDADTVLLATSGVHGLEGPAGSAVQSEWLANGGSENLPHGHAVCLVHALNAWGFAYRARATENNVDLNRNFLRSFAPPLPVNPYYAHIKDAVRQGSMSAEAMGPLIKRYEELMEELGPARLSIAVINGQYEDPEGLAFGGHKPEFGHQVVLDHVLPRLAPAKRIAFIDWHTGVGAFGEVAFLPSGQSGSPDHKACGMFWGPERIDAWKRSAAEAAIAADEASIGDGTQRSGEMRHWLASSLPHARVAGAVIEFGTERPGDMDKLVLATLYDRWLRFVDRGPRTGPAHEWLLSLHCALFIPPDPEWRRLVLTEGPKLMSQALAGAARL